MYRLNLRRLVLLLLIVFGVLYVLLTLDVLFHHGFLADTFGYHQHAHARNEDFDNSQITSEFISFGQSTTVDLELVSSKNYVSVSVDDRIIYNSGEDYRGLHVVVLNVNTARIMATRLFDTYNPGADVELIDFLSILSPNRLVCFVVADECSFHLRRETIDKITQFGSQLITKLGWRDMWAYACRTSGNGRCVKLSEGYSKSPALSEWGEQVEIKFDFKLEDISFSCSWESNPLEQGRKEFCSLYEGYGQLCDCKHPIPIKFYPPRLDGSPINYVPVAAIAGNRPRYLFRMLRGLLSARGANADLITIYIDGYFEEVKAVCKLLGLKYIENMPISSKNARIAQHYKKSIHHAFSEHSNAQFLLLVEEDLDIAPDFFSYFGQTMTLLDKDSTLYCISSWNDQGYDHSCADDSLIYRVETMPGLGWMLKRSLFEEELEPQWPKPDQFWDWDMWMRTDAIRKGRECIIPDISRTYHFGQSGLNMNSYFHDLYFKKHSINTDPNSRISNVNQLISNDYENLLHRLLRKSRLLDHTKHPCDNDFVPDTQGEIYTLYIAQISNSDENWLRVAKCFKLWDLDSRGFHKGLWRFWLKSNHILVVGVPLSPYATSHMPQDIYPIYIQPQE